MSRLVWILMLAGLFAPIGCERKPADRTPGKVTSEDVRRDAGQAVKTAGEYSEQTKEEFQKKLEAQLNELDAKIAKLREKGRDLKDQAKAQLGSEDGRVGNETGCSPRQAGRGRSLERGGLEGRPEGSPVGL